MDTPYTVYLCPEVHSVWDIRHSYYTPLNSESALRLRRFRVTRNRLCLLDTHATWGNTDPFARSLLLVAVCFSSAISSLCGATVERL